MSTNGQRYRKNKRSSAAPAMIAAGILGLYAAVQALSLSNKSVNTEDGAYKDVAAVSLMYSPYAAAYGITDTFMTRGDAQNSDIIFGYHGSAADLIGDIPGGEYNDGTGGLPETNGDDTGVAVASYGYYDGPNDDYDGHQFGVAVGTSYQGNGSAYENGDTRKDIVTLLSVDGNVVQTTGVSGLDLYDSNGSPKGDDAAIDVCMGVLGSGTSEKVYAWVLGTSSNGGITVLGYEVTRVGSTFGLTPVFTKKDIQAWSGGTQQNPTHTYNSRIAKKIYYSRSGSGGAVYIVGGTYVDDATQQDVWVCKLNAPSGTYQAQSYADFSGTHDLGLAAVIIPTDGSIVIAGSTASGGAFDTGVVQFSAGLSAQLGTKQTYTSTYGGGSPYNQNGPVDIDYAGLESGVPHVIVASAGQGDYTGGAQWDYFFANYPVSNLGTRKWLQSYNPGTSYPTDDLASVDTDLSTIDNDTGATIYLTGTRTVSSTTFHALTVVYRDRPGNTPQYVTAYADGQNGFNASSRAGAFLNNVNPNNPNFYFMAGGNSGVVGTGANPGATVWRLNP